MKLTPLKLQDTIGHDDYTSVEDVDLFIEDQVMFTVGNKYLILAQMSSDQDNTVNYTVFSAENPRFYDGGQFDCSKDNCITVGDLVVFTLSEAQLSRLKNRDVVLYEPEVDESLYS